MKIILSRKGFDSSNGGQASPILPDGTMISMPIPDNSSDDPLTFSDLCYDGISYSELLFNLPKRNGNDFSNQKCHLDPDIRPNIRKNSIDGWSPAFGQTNAAQGYLKEAGVTEGDLFLFFGWFKKTKQLENGYYRYIEKKDSYSFYDYADLHIIYGYMQIGRIICNPVDISEYYWHPHSSRVHLLNKNNVLYIPSNHLSFAPEKPGFGTLKFDRSRVLTMDGANRGDWIPYDFLMPDKIIGQNRKNSSTSGGLYYKGIWQELVFEGSDKMIEWVIKTICS